jgi:hypothetical protein
LLDRLGRTTAEALHTAGVLDTDKQTMGRFDEACMTPVRPPTAEEIRALPEREVDGCGKLRGASARSPADQSS